MDYSKESNEKKAKSNKSGKKKVANKFTTIALRVVVIAVLVAGFAVVGGGIGAYIGILQSAPSLAQIENSIQPDRENSIIYEAKSGKEIDRLIGGENMEYVTLDRIPENLRNAFIAIEDKRFYEHNGVDLRATMRALYIIFTTSDTQGGSTITQQLIKNNVLNIMRNNYKTKLQEQYLAITYEKSLTEKLGSKEKAKEQILELYLNSIGLAHGLTGVQAAALRYFNKDVSELTLSESAVIAAITQRPTTFSPINNPDNNKERQTSILNEMLAQGLITEAEHEQAMADDVYSRINAVEQQNIEKATYHSDFVDQLITEIVDDLIATGNYSLTTANLLVYSGGLKIYATIDTDMQAIVDEAYLNDELFPAKDYEIEVTYDFHVRNEVTQKITPYQKKGIIKTMEELDALLFKLQGEVMGPDDVLVEDSEIIHPVVQPQSAFALIDQYTGQVKALAGGRGEKLADRVLNRATSSPRQPGSVFKVLASFAPALDLGVATPGTVYDDVPVTVNGWTPHNWYRNPVYRGLSTVRMGIRDSMNIVTVKNFVATGADNVYDYLLNFGFTTLADRPEDNNGKTDRGPATALGGLTYGVTMLELASAYATIANGGEHIEPYLYTKITNAEGTEVILENQPETRQVLKQTSAFLLTDMMEDVITQGTGGKARFKEVKMPVAGKTGTTSDTRDLVFAGYTPYYTAAIYLGHDMPKPITDTNSYHLQLWSYIMEKIHADLPYKEFERPEGIVSEQICIKSGQLAVAGLCDHDPSGRAVINEHFVAGTQPRDYCTVHKSVRIDKETNLLATEFCPEENVTELVGIIRPVPYTGSEVIGDAQYEIPANLLEHEVDGVIVPGEYCTLHTEEGLPLFPESDPNSSGVGALDPWYVTPSPEPYGQSPLPSEPTAVPFYGGPARTPEPLTETPQNNFPTIPDSSQLPSESAGPIDDFLFSQ